MLRVAYGISAGGGAGVRVADEEEAPHSFLQFVQSLAVASEDGLVHEQGAFEVLEAVRIGFHSGVCNLYALPAADLDEQIAFSLLRMLQNFRDDCKLGVLLKRKMLVRLKGALDEKSMSGREHFKNRDSAGKADDVLRAFTGVEERQRHVFGRQCRCMKGSHFEVLARAAYPVTRAFVRNEK